MIRLRPLALAAAVVGAATLSPAAALAAAPPQITVQAGATRVEVGEPFTVELKAMVTQGDPTPQDPQISPPPGVSVTSQSEGTQMFINQSSAGTLIQVGLRAVWQLVAARPGRYTIPAPSVAWSGRRIAGTAVTVEVVPATGRPRQRQSNSPFLMPGGPGFGFNFPGFPGFPGFPQDDDQSSGPRTAPELALPTAPDASIFVHTKVDKTSVVVGQQVTLGVYVYRRIRPPQILSNHDAPLADFLRLPLAKSPGTDQPVYAMVAGDRYVAELLDRMAIFPLHAGDLHTGKVRFTFGGGTLRRPIDRASEDHVIHVTEPPRAGRPPGYTLGDVGQFSLSASVEPRRIEQGGEVSVRLELSGTGNLPQSLHMPERTGLTWLDPEKKESIEAQAGVIGGRRTFGYVVQVKDSGLIDLGEVTLPYWDPAASQYKVARATLGKIQVSPVAPATDPVTKRVLDQPAPDPFASLPGVRASLGAYTPPAPRRLEGIRMWLLIAAPPLFVGVISAGAAAARRARSRRATAKEAPATLAQKALAEARKAEAAGDHEALAAALERAVHLAVEGATGLKSRGVLVADLPAELLDRGLPDELAASISEALAGCEAARFDPSPEAGKSKDLSARVQALVAELARRKPAEGA